MGEAIVVASANPGKVAEIRTLLAEFDLLPRPAEVPEVEETGTTFVENARLKAAALVDATGIASVGDDSGIEVDALDGAPGVYSKEYAGPSATDEQNVDKLLDALVGLPDAQRTARLRTVAVFQRTDGTEIVTEGSVEGTISAERRGTGGFGFDVVFVPVEGDGRTFAQMSADEKSALSHRGRAFRALAEQLRVGTLE